MKTKEQIIKEIKWLNGVIDNNMFKSNTERATAKKESLEWVLEEKVK